MLTIDKDEVDKTLFLKGELTADSLSMLWDKQKELFNIIKNIDVTQLVNIDASGLAMLVYFCNQYAVQLVGNNEKLSALINLYGLHDVIYEST